MKRGSLISKRYAKGLLKAAEAKELVADTEAELKLIVDIFEQDATFRKFLIAPNIPLEAKKQLIKQAFGDQLSPLVFRFLDILLERGREEEIPAILVAYLQMANETLGRVDALVTSAVALTPEEMAAVAQTFSTILNKKIRISNKIDSDLLGGLMVQVGDQLYDGSLKNQLDQLRKTMRTENSY